MTQAVERWGRERVVLSSHTVRHGMGDDLRTLAAGVSNAWRSLTRSAAWKRLARRLGIAHSIRALEFTHGANGWHPHLHTLFFFADDSRSGGICTADAETWRLGSPAQREAHGAISALWRKAVRRVLGKEHVPDDVHGVDVRPCHSSSYVAKMGLEITDPGLTKRSRAGRSPWQIAHDLASYEGEGAQTVARRERDHSLWSTFVAGTKGRKMLTWSRGLKLASGIVDVSDDEAAEPLEQKPRPVGYVNLPTWKELRRTEGAREALLSAVESAAPSPSEKPLETWRLVHDADGVVMSAGELFEPMHRVVTEWLHDTGVWRPEDASGPRLRALH